MNDFTITGGLENGIHTAMIQVRYRGALVTQSFQAKTRKDLFDQISLFVTVMEDE
jgi:hypothetical protein